MRLSKLRKLNPSAKAGGQWSLFRLWQLGKEEIEVFVNTIAPLPMPARQSLRNLQRYGAFNGLFTSEK
jgi:hypothetical protein